MELSLLVTLLGLGFAYAATPGVVNTECLRRGISKGFSSAFSIQLGALIGDALWALIALTGLAALSTNASLVMVLSLIGGGFLLRLAFSAMRSAVRPATQVDPQIITGNLRTGILFGLANPAGLAFWAGIGGGVLAGSAAGSTARELSLFLLSFLIGALSWSLILSIIASWGRRFARPALLRTADAIAATLLGCFRIRMVWTGLLQLKRSVPLAG